MSAGDIPIICGTVWIRVECVPQWFIHVSKFNLHWDFIIALEAEKSKIEALVVLVCGRVCFLLPTRTSMYLLTVEEASELPGAFFFF